MLKKQDNQFLYAAGQKLQQKKAFEQGGLLMKIFTLRCFDFLKTLTIMNKNKNKKIQKHMKTKKQKQKLVKVKLFILYHI